MKPFAIFCIALLCFAYLFAPINCQEEEENEAVFEEEEGDEFETHSSQKGVVEPELEDIIGNEAKDPFAGLDFDEEEFEEVEKVAQQPAASKPQKNDVKQAEQKAKAQATPAEATPAASSFSWANHDWSVEIAFLSFLAIFGANYFYGKSANYKMAHAWAKHFFPILKQQFAVVQPFLKESPYTYRLQGYGRDNCLGIQVELSLKRRQDLVSLLYSFFSPAPDTVQIDIPLEKLEDPFVFCVVKDKNKKKFLQQFEQELDGVKSYTAQSIPSSFVVLTDAKELVDRIVTPEVASVLRQNEELVREIHLTDCYQHYVHKNILSVVLNLPKEPVGMEQLLLMSLYLIDVAANVRLSKNALAKTKKRRMALEAEVRKEAKLKNEEAAQLRKLEKQKQEKERKEKLSPAEYQKYLDKEHQRQLRKKMAPRSKVVFG